MLTEILPRIPANDATYGTTYQERTKSISARMKKNMPVSAGSKAQRIIPSFTRT